jgi:hypothetical protein
LKTGRFSLRGFKVKNLQENNFRIPILESNWETSRKVKIKFDPGFPDPARGDYFTYLPARIELIVFPSTRDGPQYKKVVSIYLDQKTYISRKPTNG